jgi:hypothetical protein
MLLRRTSLQRAFSMTCPQRTDTYNRHRLAPARCTAEPTHLETALVVLVNRTMTFQLPDPTVLSPRCTPEQQRHWPKLSPVVVSRLCSDIGVRPRTLLSADGCFEVFNTRSDITAPVAPVLRRDDAGCRPGFPASLDGAIQRSRAPAPGSTQTRSGNKAARACSLSRPWDTHAGGAQTSTYPPPPTRPALKGRAYAAKSVGQSMIAAKE